MWRDAQDGHGADVVLTLGQGEVTTVVQLRVESGKPGHGGAGEKWEGVEFGQLGNGVQSEAGAGDKVKAWAAQGTQGEDEMGSEEMVESDVASEGQAKSEHDTEVSHITSHTDDHTAMPLRQPHSGASHYDFSRSRM
jgi:hypothetical protein